MKQMRYLVLLINALAFGIAGINAQQVIALNDCQVLAQENYSVTRQKLLLPEMAELQRENTSSTYMPQLSLEGQSTWQNEVTGLDISIPGMSVEQLDKLQYKAQIAFNQVIYNGGKKTLQKKLILQGTEIERHRFEIELYALRFIINKAYFSALLLQESIESYQAMLEALKANLVQVNSAIENGAVTLDKAAALEAEIITVEQGIYKLHSQKLASLSTLELYTGLEITENDKLETPMLTLDNGSVNRPEYGLFAAQKDMFSLSSNMESAARRPHLSGFGQLGYGLPGYNMLKNEASEFYMIGARLSWKITDWKISKRNKKLNALKMQNVDYQKEIFDQKLNDIIQQQRLHLEYLNKVLSSDERLVSARKKITEVSASQLANGTIRSADYINDLQQEVSAKIRQNQHQIEKVMTMVAISTLKGNQ